MGVRGWGAEWGSETLFLKMRRPGDDGGDAQPQPCECTSCPRTACLQMVTMVNTMLHECYCDLKDRGEYKTPKPESLPRWLSGTLVPTVETPAHTPLSHQRCTVPKQVGPATALGLKTLEQRSAGDSAGNEGPSPGHASSHAKGSAALKAGPCLQPRPLSLGPRPGCGLDTSHTPFPPGQGQGTAVPCVPPLSRGSPSATTPTLAGDIRTSAPVRPSSHPRPADDHTC